jgi:hypothetical protein
MGRKQRYKIGERPRRMADGQHAGPGAPRNHYFPILEARMSAQHAGGTMIGERLNDRCCRSNEAAYSNGRGAKVTVLAG